MKPKGKPLDAPLMRAISLGAGVQSTAMALMAAEGAFGVMPDCAIFADTRAEPAFVYETVEWLKNTLPFPVHTVVHSDLAHDLVEGRFGAEYGTYPAIPYFLSEDPVAGGRGIRGCSGPYKARPIARFQRQLLGVGAEKNLPPKSVETWLGISIDEAIRMKPAPNRWQENRYPLIEKRLSRQDCIRWLLDRNYPVPERSACTFCPYRSDEEWRRLKAKDPAGFAQACKVDEALRDVKGRLGLESNPYLHRSRKPLADVEFRPQTRDLFGEECSGLCGV